MHLPTLTRSLRAWWIVLAVLVALYMIGTWLNRRRSKELGLWLAAGVGVLGGQTLWKWVGTMTSGAQVTIVGANRPFKQGEILYLLLTREFLPLWGIELLRGKRDLLVMRVELAAKPAREFEVVPLNGDLRKTLDRNPGAIPWNWQEMPAGLGLATHLDPGGQTAAAVRKFLDAYGPFVQRLSLRKGSPQLILFAQLSGIERKPAKEFLGAVRDVVAALEPKG